MLIYPIGNKNILISLFFLICTIFVFIYNANAIGNKNDTETKIEEEGKRYIERFEFDKAIKLFSKQILDEPENYKWCYYLGESIRNKLFFARYKELSKEKEKELINKSKSSYIKALELNPDFIKSKIGIAKLEAFGRNYDSAIMWYLQAMNDGMDDPEIYKSIGKMYAKKGQLESARDYYKAGDHSVGENNISELKVSKFIENILLNGETIDIESYVAWKIADPNLYKGQIGNKEYAQILVRDVYSAKFNSVIKLLKKDELIKDNGEIKNEIIHDCNSGKLKELGIEVIDIQWTTMPIKN